MRIIAAAAQTTFWPIAWLGLLSTLSLSLTGFIALHANCSSSRSSSSSVCSFSTGYSGSSNATASVRARAPVCDECLVASVS